MSDLDDLTAKWVQGWVAARTLPAPEDLGDGLLVRCNQWGREVEIFGRDNADALERLAARVRQAADVTWLTVPTTHPDQIASALQAHGLSILRQSELLMTADLGAHPDYGIPEAYTMIVEEGESSVFAEVRAENGEPAARGVVGLAGSDAVMDKILTLPDHRRRGLGNAVMSTLAAAAVARGSTRGILISSEDGQRLYPALGWSGVAWVVIAAAPGTAYPSA